MSLTPEFFDLTRGKNVLLIEPFYWTPHVETGLEIADLLSSNNHVTYVGPDALGCTTDETVSLRSRIRIQLTRKRDVSRRAAPAVRTYSRAEIAAIERKLELPDVNALFASSDQDLPNIRFEDFDVGMSVFSSLVSLTRDPYFDPAKYRKTALQLGKSAINIYRLTQHLAREHEIDLVVFFNGRLASTRAIRRACESMRLRYIVHERGSSRDKYALFDCATPHQPKEIRRWVDEWWQATPDAEQKGRDFFDRRRKNIATSWYSFTDRQSAGHIPARTGRVRVTFFTSSDDELIALGDELPPDTPYCDQIYAIRAVGKACAERSFEFVVRFHPNTPAGQTELFAAADEVSSTVIEPLSPVDTYALMDSSDIVFTQNSTVGIEAAASGKPVFYTGRDIFEHCRSVKRIKTEADLAEALDNPRKPDPMDAIRYGNFFGEHGISHRLYQSAGFLSGTYRGVDLNAPVSTLKDLARRIIRRVA